MRQINPRLNIFNKYKKMGNIINPFIFGGIPRDYVLAYDFNGNTNDKSGNALNGTLVGGANITNNRLNIASTAQYMQTSDSSLLSFGSGAFSFSFKVLITSVGASNLNYIVSKRTDSSFINNARNEWQCLFNNRKFEFYIIDCSKTSNAYLQATTNMTFNLNQEYKIQITFSGDIGNFFKIYVDGSIVTHTYIANGIYTQMRDTTAVVRTGLNGWAANYSLLGYLDNLYVYNRVLTQTEITALNNE